MPRCMHVDAIAEARRARRGAAPRRPSPATSRWRSRGSRASRDARRRARAAAEIEDVRTRAARTRRPLRRARRASRTSVRVLGVRAVVVGGHAVERALRVEQRALDLTATARSSSRSSIEQTQRVHTGSAPTSSVRRNARRLSRDDRRERRVGGCCRRARGRSRAAPSRRPRSRPTSTARCRRRGGNGAVAGERGVVLRQPAQLVGRLGNEARLEIVAIRDDRVLDEGLELARPRSRSSASAAVASRRRRSRPNAVDETSAARNEMPSSPSPSRDR